MTAPRTLLALGFFGVCVAYVYGLVLGAIALVWDWLFVHRLPDWTWWQFALAPLVIGVVAAGLELGGEYLGNGFAIGKEAPSKWKQSMGAVVLFVFLVVITLGPAFYKIKNG
jgi:hypothetical protein